MEFSISPPHEYLPVHFPTNSLAPTLYPSVRPWISADNEDIKEVP